MARAKPPALRLPMRVWDLPVRLFHWAIVLLVALSYASYHLRDPSNGWMQAHLIAGYTMLTLLLFRLVWGFLGSDTALFRKFLVSPLAGLRHLAKFGRRAPDDQVGHNEAGGWMVIGLLLLLGAQVATGLFAHDRRTTLDGPLVKYVTEGASHQLSGLHSLLFNVLLGLIGLHVLAIVAYAVVQRQDLVRPMITGKKRLPATTRAPRMVDPRLAFVVLLLAAAVVAAFVTQV